MEDEKLVKSSVVETNLWVQAVHTPLCSLSILLWSRMTVFIGAEVLPRKAAAAFGFPWAITCPTAESTRGPVGGCTGPRSHRQTDKQINQNSCVDANNNFLSEQGHLKAEKRGTEEHPTLAALFIFFVFSRVCPGSPGYHRLVSPLAPLSTLLICDSSFRVTGTRNLVGDFVSWAHLLQKTNFPFFKAVLGPAKSSLFPPAVHFCKVWLLSGCNLLLWLSWALGEAARISNSDESQREVMYWPSLRCVS